MGGSKQASGVPGTRIASGSQSFDSKSVKSERSNSNTSEPVDKEALKAALSHRGKAKKPELASAPPPPAHAHSFSGPFQPHQQPSRPLTGNPSPDPGMDVGSVRHSAASASPVPAPYSYSRYSELPMNMNPNLNAPTSSHRRDGHGPGYFQPNDGSYGSPHQSQWMHSTYPGRRSSFSSSSLGLSYSDLASSSRQPHMAPPQHPHPTPNMPTAGPSGPPSHLLPLAHPILKEHPQYMAYAKQLMQQQELQDRQQNAAASPASRRGSHYQPLQDQHYPHFLASASGSLPQATAGSGSFLDHEAGSATPSGRMSQTSPSQHHAGQKRKMEELQDSLMSADDKTLAAIASGAATVVSKVVRSKALGTDADFHSSARAPAR